MSRSLSETNAGTTDTPAAVKQRTAAAVEDATLGPDQGDRTTAEPQREPGARHRLRSRPIWRNPRVVVPAVAFVVLTPLYIYYSSLIGMGSNSDAAINVLEGYDMSHGRPLLQGWTQGNNSFMTHELIVYAIVALFLGVQPAVIYVSQGILYVAVVIATWLLATSRIKDRTTAIVATALVGAIMLPVNRETTGWMMLGLIDHLSTSILLMVLLLVLDRARMTWRLGVVAFIMLTWATTSDHITFYLCTVPLVLVAGLRAYFQAENRKTHIALVIGALASLPADALFKTAVEALGGAERNTPPDPIFAYIADLPLNFWETINSIMIVFGAPMFGRELAMSKQEAVHMAALAVAVAGWYLALRNLRRLNLVDQVLITGIAINVIAFLFSPMPGPDYTAHELLIIVPYSVALATRLIVPRLTSLRTRLPVYAGFAMALVLLAYTLAGVRTPSPIDNLTQFLREERLTYGIGGFWEAASVTVHSHDEVRVRHVINDGHGNVTQPWQAMRDDWYDPDKYDARFIVDHPGEGELPIYDLNEELLTDVFGPAERTVRVGEYIVRIYDYNILTRIPQEKLPHQL